MIPPTSHEDLLSAMGLFDQERRPTGEWGQWEQNRAHKFAIEHRGELYPVKEIISLATQLPVSGFSGGEEANAYVRRYGFEVVPLSETSESDRISAEAARRAVERMFPIPDQRRFCLSVLADTIVAASSIDTGKWSLSLTREIDVNVGRVVVCAVRAKGVWLALDKASLSDEAQTSLGGRIGEEWYKSLPNTTGLDIPPDAPADLVSMVWDAHLAFLKRAASPVDQIRSRSREAHSPSVLAYLRSELRRDVPSPVFEAMSSADSPRNVWWVNQGKSYANGFKNHSLWAPLKGKGGRVPHWERMREVKTGDVIVHYGIGMVRAISRARRDAFDARRPQDHTTSSGTSPWEDDGTLVDAEYFELTAPVPLAAISSSLSALVPPDGPLDKTGGVNQGYLYRLNDAALGVIRKASTDAWPDWALSALGESRSWVFQGTPARFDAAGAVRALPQLTWRVTQHVSEVHVGDEVFLWATGADGGLVAAALVLTEPEFIGMADEEAPYVKDTAISVNDVRRVWLAIEDVLSPAIPRQVLLDDPDVGDLPVFKGWQGTNYALTPAQAAALHRLINAPSVNETPTMTYPALLSALRRDGLYFSEELVSNYLLALQTKRFVILSGISGTGKTQLALAVARQYRRREQVATEEDVTPGALRMLVRPYSLKYHRIQLPVSFTSQMQFPPLADGKSGTIRVHYPDGEMDQSLYVDNQPGRNAVALLFSGKVRQWFVDNLQEGDHFFLDLVPGEDGPDALRLDLAQKTRVYTEERDTYVTVAVRPDWTDNRGLLGYYNPITARYHTSPFTSLLLEAKEEEEKAKREGRAAHPYFLILDEMNLARVEHYFSDFLSCLDSGEPLHLHDSPVLDPDEDQEGPSVPQLLPIPKNVFFTGTVNVDETTSMFSPKVVDRAFTLEFNSVDLAGYGAALPSGSAPSPLALKGLPVPIQYRGNPGSVDWQALGGRDAESRQTLVALHRLLSEYNRHFGYRVANEIARFLNLAAEQTDDTPNLRKAALDLAVLQKVLPKFHGTQQELQTVLGFLFSFAVAGKTGVAHTAADWGLSEGVLTRMDGSAAALALPRTAAKLWRMLERLQEQGFTSFME